MARKKSGEYIEVLSQIILSNVPELKPERASALLEDILNHVGREDYRYLHETLAGEHSKLLDEMEDLLKRIVTALDDAIIITNSDCVNREKIEATAERISRAGGKMKYFATLIEEIADVKRKG